MLTISCNERDGIGNFNLFTNTAVMHLHAFLVLTGADAHEGDPVTVLWIHICLYLEDESGKAGIISSNRS